MSTEVSERRIGSNVAKLMERLSKDLSNTASASKPPEVILRGNHDKKRSARVRYSYSPQNDDELRLEVDDEVEIICEAEDGWLKGRIRGKEGVFPSNFCDILDESEKIRKAGDLPPTSALRPPLDIPSLKCSDTSINTQSDTPSSLNNMSSDHTPSSIDSLNSPKEKDTSEIMPKKVKGLGFGIDIFGGGGVIRRPTDSKEAAKAVSASPRMSSTASPMEGDRSYARADYDYTADNEDELSFLVSDIITVLNKNCEDPGWWFGELNGKRGMIPDNFVKEISVEEALRDKKRPISPPAVPSKPKSNAPTSGRPSTPEATKKDEDRKPSETRTTSARLNFFKDIGGTCATPPALPHKDSKNGQSDGDKMPPEKAKKPSIGAGLFNKHPPIPKSNNSPTKEDKLEGSMQATCTDRLAHPTAERPKQKQKRPPSKVFLEQMGTKDTSPSPSPVCEGVPSLPNPKPLTPSVVKPLVVPVSSVTNKGDNPISNKSSEGEWVKKEVFDQLKKEFYNFKTEMLHRMQELEKHKGGVEEQRL